MTVDRQPLTPEQARDHLGESRTPVLLSSRDRRIHAVSTAALGLTMAFFLAAQNMVSGTGTVARLVLFAVVWMALTIGVERATRTVPRRARVRSRLGMAGTAFLSLGVALPWLNLRAQTEPNTWSMVLTAGFLASAPAIAAAVTIARGRT